MKSKGVKITRISKAAIAPTIKDSTKKREKSLPVNDINENVIQQNHLYQRDDNDKIFSTPQNRKNSRGLRKSIKILLLLSILLTSGYYISNIFDNVKVNIIAKTQSFDLNKKQFVASSDTNQPIHFELMIVSSEDYKEVSLNDSEKVSYKAKGEVTFFNEYSTKSQAIALHSFISDNTGKTYQTDKAITIPGYKTVNGKITPGQASVGITAFLAGEEYNGSPNDFKVNAYKGTVKASKIYAKLKTPLSGGAQGVVYKLGPTEKGQINATAESSFKSNLIKKVNAEVPPGYILYPDAINFSYKTNSDTLFDSQNAKVVINGTVSSIILNQKDLSKALTKSLLPDISEFESKEVNITDISNLKFSFVKTDQSITKELKSINFFLTGKANAIWILDVPSLQSKLAGANKVDLTSRFKSDPGIVSATARIFPPWQSYLPNDISKIHINVN